MEALKSSWCSNLKTSSGWAISTAIHGLVFTLGVGVLINPTILRKRSFAPLLQKAGLPQIRFHDLRHTCATLLLTRNMHPKYVQDLLGHATVAITLDTYSHMVPGMGTHTVRDGRCILLDPPQLSSNCRQKGLRGAPVIPYRTTFPLQKSGSLEWTRRDSNS
jgi:Phage integrase family